MARGRVRSLARRPRRRRSPPTPGTSSRARGPRPARRRTIALGSDRRAVDRRPQGIDAARRAVAARRGLPCGSDRARRQRDRHGRSRRLDGRARRRGLQRASRRRHRDGQSRRGDVRRRDRALRRRDRHLRAAPGNTCSKRRTARCRDARWVSPAACASAIRRPRPLLRATSHDAARAPGPTARCRSSSRFGIWFTPVPAGLTAPAWHLFAVFVAAIASVLVGAFPLLTSTMLAVAAVVLTGTISPAQAFGGFANASVLLVVIAFLVAQAVVKSGLGHRISLFMVSRFGRSPLGLAYSIVLTDAVIAPAFPSNTARGGVLYPVVLSVAQGAGSRPDDPESRRLGGYLMFCGMASLAVSSALWMTATSANPIGIQVAREFGLDHRLRHVAGRRVGARADRDPPAAAGRGAALFAGRARHARRSGRRAHGARGDGPAVPRREDHRGGVRADGGGLDLRRPPEAQRDQHRVRRARRAADDQCAHDGRHRQAGRHARHVPVARGALRAVRPAERARFHELRRAAARGAARPDSRGR